MSSFRTYRVGDEYVMSSKVQLHVDDVQWPTAASGNTSDVLVISRIGQDPESETSNDRGAYSFGAGSSSYSNSGGCFYRYALVAITPIAVAQTWYKIQGATTPKLLSNFTHSEGRLTYTGASTKSFVVNLSITVETGVLRLMREMKRLGAFPHGTVISPYEMKHRKTYENIPDNQLLRLFGPVKGESNAINLFYIAIGVNGNASFSSLNMAIMIPQDTFRNSVTLSGVVSLSNGDYVEPFIMNYGGTTAARVQHINLNIKE